MTEDVDPSKVAAARAIEVRLGYDRPRQRAATEDDQVVGGLQMVLDQELLKYGLPPAAGLTGLLRHLEGNRALTDWAQGEHISRLQGQVNELMRGVRAMIERGELVELVEAARAIQAIDVTQQYDEDHRYVTKTGRVLSDADIERLADEAEQGHDGPPV